MGLTPYKTWHTPLFLGGSILAFVALGMVDTVLQPVPPEFRGGSIMDGPGSLHEAAQRALASSCLMLFASFILSLPLKPSRLWGGVTRIVLCSVAAGIAPLLRTDMLPGTSPSFVERHNMWNAVIVASSVAPLVGLIWGWVYMMRKRPSSQGRRGSQSAPAHVADLVEND